VPTPCSDGPRTTRTQRETPCSRTRERISLDRSSPPTAPTRRGRRQAGGRILDTNQQALDDPSKTDAPAEPRNKIDCLPGPPTSRSLRPTHAIRIGPLQSAPACRRVYPPNQPSRTRKTASQGIQKTSSKINRPNQCMKRRSPQADPSQECRGPGPGQAQARPNLAFPGPDARTCPVTSRTTPQHRLNQVPLYPPEK